MAWIWAVLLLWGGKPEAADPAAVLVESPVSQVGRAFAPVIAVDEGGNPGIAWESSMTGMRVQFAVRGAGGWSAPVVLAPGGGASGPRLAAAGGRWYAAWQSRHRGFPMISTQLRVSSDGGRTWDRLTGWGGEGAEPAAPREGGDFHIMDPGERGTMTLVQSQAVVAATGSHVAVAWEAQLMGRERDIYLARSSDHGGTWIPGRRVCTDPAGSASSFHPSLALFPDGEVCAVWWDMRDGLSDLYCRRTRAGAADGWDGPEFRLDPGAPGDAESHDARLEMDGDTLRVVWREGFGTGVWMQRVSADRGLTWDAARPAPDAEEPVPGRSRVRHGGLIHTVEVSEAPGPLEYRRELAP